MEKIENVKTNEKNSIANKSADSLPNNPSARGVSADDIRKKLYQPIIDTTNSVVTVIDRIVDEANAALDDLDGRIEANKKSIGTMSEALVGAINENKSGVEKNKNAIEENKNAIQETRNSMGTMSGLKTTAKTLVGAINENKSGIEKNKSDISYIKDNVKKFPDYEKWVDEHKANSDAIEQNRKDIKKHEIDIERNLSYIDDLLTQAEGNSRNYVGEDFFFLIDLMDDLHDHVSLSDLITGDNILIVEHGVPDFWVEVIQEGDKRLEDEYWLIEAKERAGRYIYDGNEWELWCEEDGNLYIFHILESDYTVIEGYSKSASSSAQEAAVSAREAAASARDAATSAREAAASVEAAKEAAGGVEIALEGKVDKVSAMEGKQYTIAAVDMKGNETSLAVDIGMYGLAIPLRENRGNLRVADPTTDYHAINMRYLNKHYGTHEDRISAMESLGNRIFTVEKMVGLAETEFKEITGKGTVTIPGEALPSAKILKIYGSPAIYTIDELGYQRAIPNSPKSIIIGDTQIELPTQLSDFGLTSGNYIYFENGRAIYHQEHRIARGKPNDTRDNYQEGEVWGEQIAYDHTGYIILAKPIETDISDLIGFDGIIDVRGADTITINPVYTENEIAAWSYEGKNYRHDQPTLTVVFEV